MADYNQKTIAAISTAQAPGGIGIIRISGIDAKKIASKVFLPAGKKEIEKVPGYTALYGHTVNENGENIDEALALVFSAPKSYTGEDVVELSCHGGMFIMQEILSCVIKAGAFPAAAGEFTKRAFLNGKMDLTKAESVMQLISAEGSDALKAARAAFGGTLQKKIEKVKKELVSSAAHLSAWADYPEDEVPEITEDELKTSFHNAENLFSELLSQFDKGKKIREGVRTVIAGKPNVGKSTIMNLLSGFDRSIVTEYAGTTRDVIEDAVNFAGIPLLISDTAGIRETSDPVEKIGVEKAFERIENAQLVLAVFDYSSELGRDDCEIIEKTNEIPTIAIINKTDLSKKIDTESITNRFNNCVYISAETGEGISDLEKKIKEVLKLSEINPSEGILFTERQRDAVNRAKECLQEAISALEAGLTFDAVTVSLESCISALLEFTGEKISDTVLNEVFSKFCVGK